MMREGTGEAGFSELTPGFQLVYILLCLETRGRFEETENSTSKTACVGAGILGTNL